MEQSTSSEQVNILLVDDREGNLLALAAVLQNPDYRLVMADSGHEALRLLLKEEFAVVLLDVAMPGMDGFETAALIKRRERTARLPIIFVTASIPDVEHIFKGYSVGAVDYLRKPVDPHVVRAKVAVFAELYRQQRQIRRQAEVIEENARRQRELELSALQRASEERYRNLADAIPQIVWIAGPDGAINHFNAQFAAYSGLTADEGAGRGWLDRVHPDDRARVEQRMAEGIASAAPFQLEFRLLRADGSYRWHLSRARPELGPPSPDGQQVIAWLGTFTDFDAQRRTLAALDQFKASLDAVLDTVWIFSADSLRFLYVNEGAVSLAGYSREELLAMSPLDLEPEGSPVDFRGALEEVRQHGGSRTLSLELSRRTGEVLPVEMSIQFLAEEHGGGRYVSIVRDVSKRRAAERERAELLRREQLARAEAEAARERTAFLAEVGASIAEELDPSGATEMIAKMVAPRWADACLIALYGDDPGQLTGAVLERGSSAGSASALEVAAAAQPLLRQALSGGVRTGGAAEFPAELGARLPAGAWLCAPLSARGRLLGAMLWSRDPGREGYGLADLGMVDALGHRIGLALDNARLYRASQEAVMVRDEFLSIASHELRTPLTALQLHLQGLVRGLVRSGGEVSRANVLERLVVAQRQTERLGNLIDSLLDVARISTGRLKLHRERFSLVEAAREVCARFAEQVDREGCQLRLAVESEPTGCWDRVRIEQIITNLLSNAVKYSPGKPIELAVGHEDGWATLRVRDEGIGIDEEALPRIFDRFERAVPSRSYGGLGLGLYITRQIAEAHGGHVRAESRKGQGALFVVELPLEPEAQQGARDEPGAEAGAGS